MSAAARREVAFEARDFALQSGQSLPVAGLVARTYGELAPARDNVVLFATKFGSTHADNEFLIGPGRVLDTERYFVVCVNMLGAGLSSSPSNSAAPFPLVTLYDNVRLQRLLLDSLDVREVQLVLGVSMGGMQAYHWAVRYPEMVRRVAVICGAAKVASHNSVFLDGMKAILELDPGPRGLRAAGRAWAPWALSQTFYREELYRGLGCETAREFVVRCFEERFLTRDARDLLAQIASWQAADVGAIEPFHGDTTAALRSIQAPVLLMPGACDLYFTVADSERELAHLLDGALRPIPSDWGHWAGNDVDAAAVDFMQAALGELLAR
jgi:homoserine O-acetyltransferase